MVIKIKNWQSQERSKIIKILQLLRDCYDRVLFYYFNNRSRQSIDRINKIISETQDFLIETLIKIHKEGEDDGTSLAKELPEARNTKLPDIKPVSNTKIPIEAKF